MANSTTEYWDIDGVSLQTFAWNITTWGGSKQGTPPLRGSDLQIPSRPGQIWQPKVVDSRTIDFQGWVIGADADGNIGNRQVFLDNWQMLKRLFFQPGRQLQLTRRWKETVGGVVTSFSATGLGEVLDAIEPEMTGDSRAEFSVSVFMADPYLYSAQKSVSVALGGTQVRTIAGSDAARRIKVTLTPTISTARLEVTTPRIDTYIDYTLVSPDPALIDVDNFSVTENGVRTLNKLSHKPTTVFWLSLPVGSATFKLTGTGTGSATVTYQEVWV